MPLRLAAGAEVPERGDRGPEFDREYIDGEKVIQGFLAAYLSATDHFVFHNERELGGTTGRRRSGSLPQGYADICLEPHLQRYTGIRHGYVIELKHLKRGEPASEERAARAAKEAAAQVRRYVADERLARQYRELSTPLT